MSENLFDLYSQKILALATDIPRTAPIEPVDVRVKKRSPICGSEVEVSIHVEDGVIADYAQVVNACALGQASSAIFGKEVVGRNRDEIDALYQQLSAFLSKKGEAPLAPFDEYELLRPAQEHRNRHRSILLPVEATLEALNQL